MVTTEKLPFFASSETHFGHARITDSSHLTCIIWQEFFLHRSHVPQYGMIYTTGMGWSCKKLCSSGRKVIYRLGTKTKNTSLLYQMGNHREQETSQKQDAGTQNEEVETSSQFHEASAKPEVEFGVLFHGGSSNLLVESMLGVCWWVLLPQQIRPKTHPTPTPPPVSSKSGGSLPRPPIQFTRLTAYRSRQHQGNTLRGAGSRHIPCLAFALA